MHSQAGLRISLSCGRLCTGFVCLSLQCAALLVWLVLFSVLYQLSLRKGSRLDRQHFPNAEGTATVAAACLHGHASTVPGQVCVHLLCLAASCWSGAWLCSGFGNDCLSRVASCVGRYCALGDGTSAGSKQAANLAACLHGRPGRIQLLAHLAAVLASLPAARRTLLVTPLACLSGSQACLSTGQAHVPVCCQCCGPWAPVGRGCCCCLLLARMTANGFQQLCSPNECTPGVLWSAAACTSLGGVILAK